MSRVTNVILSIGSSEIECKDVEPKIVPYGLLRAIVSEYELVREINQWLNDHRHGAFGEEITAGNVAGGDKGFEATVYVGAFNHLVESAFIEFVLTRPWQYPEQVQIFVKGQEEIKFSVYEIGVTTTLTHGERVTTGHREIDPATGQQKGYVVLSANERSKGFVRPVRRSYVHEKCGTVTTIAQELAETYARDPNFYKGTFCVTCRAHFPVGASGEFVWDGTGEKVGT